MKGGDVYSILNLNDLNALGNKQAINVSAYILMFGLLFTAAVLFLAAAGVNLILDPLVVAGIVFAAFGLSAFAVGLYLLWKRAGQVKRVVEIGINHLQRQFECELSAPDLPELPAPTLPALPAEDEPIKFTHFSRGGEVEEIPRKLLHGFDPRDLEFLCRQLARGFNFAEAYMEKIELPYSHEVMGKAQEGTAYNRFMDVCTRAGIVTGREGKKRGNLNILLASEMMAAIRNLPES